MHKHLPIIAAGLALTTALTIGACATDDGAEAAPKTVKRATVTTSSAITFAYAGDSITARGDSWWYAMQSDARFQSVGGFAKSGYRSDQVLENIKPVTDADVLVLELGTNDLNQKIDTATILDNLQSIVLRVGAKRVLVVAAPPSNVTGGGCCNTNRNAAVSPFNRQLAIWAGTRGYVYYDPFVIYREADNTWTSGADADGVHGTADANANLEKWFAWGIQQANQAGKVVS